MNRATFLLPFLLLMSSLTYAENYTPVVFMEGGVHFGGGDLPSNGPGAINLYEIDGGELLSGSIGLASDLGDLFKSVFQLELKRMV